MRTIFVGASAFGLRCLNAVYRIPGISVQGVITNPRTFNISYSSKPVTNVLHADFVAWAAENSVPCFEMASSMRDPLLLDWLRPLAPDVFVVVGWYHMIPKSVRDIAPAIGLHASLLPDYSGGAPLVWAMINGESKTGITLFQMDDGVDSGPIIGQAEELISPDDTIASLYARIETLGLNLLQSQLPALAAGTAALRVQDEAARRIFPQRSPADGWIDWHCDAAAIDRFIRAQTRPYPGAFTTLDSGEALTIWAARCVEPHGVHAPCSLTKVAGEFHVNCTGGSLQLLEIGYQGRIYGVRDMEQVLGSTRQLGARRHEESANRG